MMRYKCASTVTTSETLETSKRGNICRLRLTLPIEDTSSTEKNEVRKEKIEKLEKASSPTRRRRKNGIIHPEHNGTEPPTLHLYTVPKGGSTTGTTSHGMVYGVVQRPDSNHQNEVVVYEWSTNQLKEEMNYIKDQTRAALETSGASPAVVVFRPGDEILVKVHRRKSCLAPRWEGPYTVLLATSHAIRVLGRKNWVHVTHARLFNKSSTPVPATAPVNTSSTIIPPSVPAQGSIESPFVQSSSDNSVPASN